MGPWPEGTHKVPLRATGIHPERGSLGPMYRMCHPPYSAAMSRKAPTTSARKPRSTRIAGSHGLSGQHLNLIAEARLTAGLTQAQVIAASGLSESYYKKLEAGSRPLTADTLVILAGILRCRPVDLVPPDADDATREQLLLANFRLMDDAARQLLLATARQFAG